VRAAETDQALLRVANREDQAIALAVDPAVGAEARLTIVVASVLDDSRLCVEAGEVAQPEAVGLEIRFVLGGIEIVILDSCTRKSRIARIIVYTKTQMEAFPGKRL